MCVDIVNIISKMAFCNLFCSLCLLFKAEHRPTDCCRFAVILSFQTASPLTSDLVEGEVTLYAAHSQ